MCQYLTGPFAGWSVRGNLDVSAHGTAFTGAANSRYRQKALASCI